MATSTIGSLDHTLQETHAWLKKLAQAQPFGNEEQAYSALRAVLHSLRDRLTVEEAAHFSAQLPMLIRGFYFEGWRPALAPNDEATAEEFLFSVRESLRNASFTLEPEGVTRAVFSFLEERVDPGQIAHVKGQLPAEVQELWPTGV